MKKYLIVIFTIIITLLLVIFFASLHKSPPSSQIPTIAPIPTEVPLPPTAFRNVTLTSLSPVDGSTDVSIFASISATFSRPLTSAEREHIIVTLNPSAPGSLTWSPDATTLTFSVSQSLQTNKQYVTNLTFLNTNHAWSFSTISEENLSDNEKAQLQIQADNAWGRYTTTIANNYPWYDSLPISSNSYFVYFDLNSKKFIAILYVSSSDKKVEDLKKDILSQFQSFNIPTNHYSIVWQYNPTPGFE